MTKLSYAIRSIALVGLLALALTPPAHSQIAPLPPMPPDAPEAPMALPPPLTPLAALAPMGGWSGLRFFSTREDDRGYLGLTLRTSSGADDTLGVLVDDVESGLPADKAGIRRGARLVSADGVDLRVDANDLGDSAAEALPETRLRRLLGTKDAGDDLTLVVLTDGRKSTYRVALAESPVARALAAVRATGTGRRVLGLGFSQRGSIRDTAGLLIISISSNGAADKAGLSEGDRIVRIDGIDLRVPAADAGTAEAVDARVSRLRRALDAAKDSQAVRLDVLSDGRNRTVTVVPRQESGFSFTINGMQDLFGDARASVRASLDMSQERSEMARAHAEQFRAQAQAQRDRGRAQAEVQREMAREMARVQRDQMRTRASETRDSWSRDDDDDDLDERRDARGDARSDDRRDDGRSDVRGTIRGRTDGATLVLSGLSLAAVDRDFARQFGRGSEDGALVVRTRREWEPIRTGDVILSVDGRSVRDANSLDITFDRRRDQRLEILRNGRKESITLPATR